ncbi:MULTISPECIES: M23 family metallopeptidase [unclassified Salinibacterium]|uniref:M23 family metallopeptidase n=1 Tax=unclassified Salinibacterium TaxID=2632331 RepID=UPI001E6191A8|nr:MULTISPECIES: M23 family metallopeptidase [unclassified Salinibacterium]
MKRTITMLAVGAILVGGTVPAAVFPTHDNDVFLADAATLAAPPASATSTTTVDDVQTFASPATGLPAPVVRDSYDVEQVQQQVVVTAAGLTGTLELFPANGDVNDGFGYRDGNEFHGGIDIMAPEGSDIIAASPGTVESVTDGGGWGRHVIIDHGNGIKTLYAHMIEGSQVVTAGQWVAAGTVLGSVGNTGYSTFPHLHFEVYVFDTRVDPTPWLP